MVYYAAIKNEFAIYTLTGKVPKNIKLGAPGWLSYAFSSGSWN